MPTPVPVKVEPETSTKLLPGACRTTVITTVSDNIRVPTSVRICPYPPFTLPIPKTSPSPTGEPSDKEVPIDEPPPTTSALLDGACVTRTTEIVSNGKTITTVTTACPYPTRKTPTITSVSIKSPTPSRKSSTEEEPTDEVPIDEPPPTTSSEVLDGACVTKTIEITSNNKPTTTVTISCPGVDRKRPMTTSKQELPKPSPIGKGIACPPSKILKFAPTCLGERKIPCRTPCSSTVTVTSTGACACIGAKQQVTGSVLGPVMCPNYCGCRTSTKWTLPAGCKTVKTKQPKPTAKEEDGYGGY
ncbi:hypothetical protein TWF506_005176 [Arthrobotrys conoides]|uniref:Uncharacterized protein n=1 Tax=Arthrobotrys conoides TaxID=74498 RepID=A0AAN8NTL7_9PEZI